MYKFTYEQPETHAPYSAVKSVTMEVADEATVYEMLEAFKEFLNGTGYHITGAFDIIEPDTEEWK